MHLYRLPRFQLLQHSQLDEDSYHSLLISLLRGLAAIEVAAAHLRYEFMPSLRAIDQPALWYQGLAFVTGFAHQAVLVFFLISGWLVGGSLYNKWERPQALKLYAIDRLSRLWTVMIPAFALTIALGIATGTLTARGVDFAADNPYSATSLVGNLLALQTVALPQFGGNYALWSLANESWYYLMFPLVLLHLAGRRSAPCAIALMLIGAALPIKITLYFSLWLLGALFSRVRFACGAPTRVLLLVLLTGLSVYFRLYGSNDGMEVDSFNQDLLLSLVFLPLLCSTVILPRPGLTLLAPLRRTAALLSRFSFTLYVVHVPLMVTLRWLGQHWFGRQSLAARNLADLGIYLALLALVLAFAYGFYLLFEAHTGQVRRALRKCLLTKPQPVLRAIAKD